MLTKVAIIAPTLIAMIISFVSLKYRKLIGGPTSEYSSRLLEIEVVVRHENQRNRAELKVKHSPAESDPK